jgi:type II secretory pathway pseudopilin PulG
MLVSFRIRGERHGERGYVMLLLLLMVAVMIIGLAVIVPSIAFDIKRDREEEMVHRGVQYSRAIRLYYKKFGRYPAKIEDLENTNQIRFLRKRYKDPITRKDFKLLHYGEAKMSLNALGGAAIPGASTLGANGALVNAASSSTFGSNNNAFGSNSGFGSNSAFGGNSGFGASSNSAFGQSAQTSSNQTTTGATGSDNSQTTTSASAGGTDQTAAGNTTGNSGDKLSSTTFGGAPIVGVASLSKDPTIRVFDNKKKYNEWQFVYDPTFDRGFLITTPYQPSVQGLTLQGTTNLNGQNGSGQNGNNNGFGNSFGTGFGNSSSPMQNQPISPAGGNGSQNLPNAPTPQQQ